MRLLSKAAAAMALAAALAEAQDGTYLEALVLLGEAASAPQEISEALSRLENVRANFEEFARFHMALGELHLKRGDRAAAERAIRRAVEAEPEAASSYLALGRILEGRNELEEAERAYATAARLSPPVSPARLVLADFYIKRGKTPAARDLLEAMTDDDPNAIPAWRVLGEMAMRQNDYASAAQAATEILERLPSDVPAKILAARARAASGRPQEAISLLESVTATHPEEAVAHYELGRAYLAAGDTEKATQSLHRASDLVPSAPGPYVVLAECYIRTGERAMAVGVLDPVLDDESVEDERFRKEALRLLGTAYVEGNDFERALDAWESYRQSAPREALGPHSVGRTHAALGNLGEAERELELALELDPAFAPALAELAKIGFQKNQGSVVLGRVEKQLARVPHAAPMQRLLGDVHRKLGNRTEAEERYRRALELDPSSIDGYRVLGSLLIETDRRSEAMALLEEAREKWAGDIQLLLLLADLSSRMGDPDGARRHYEQVLALDPESAPAANNLAYVFLDIGDLDRALELASKARALDGENPDIADTLGWVYYRRGAFHAARALLVEAATGRADNAEVQYHLGMALYRLRELAEGARYLERALQLDPTAAFAAEAHRTLDGIRSASVKR